MVWALDLAVVVLLLATLVQAVRLQRALSAMQRERGPLDALIGQFDSGAREAQAGIERLREAADGAARTLARHTQTAGVLSQDIGFLLERGEALADRLERLVGAANRPADPRPAPPAVRPLPPLPLARPEHEAPRVRSRAEQELLAALRMPR